MWLSHLVKAMTDSEQPHDSRIGIAGGIIYYSQPNDIIWGGPGRIDLTTGSTWQPDGFRRSVQHATDIDYIAGGAILIKREVFENIGTLDGEYFLYSEDVDFSMRALRANYRLKIVPRAKSWHLMSMGTQKISLRAYYLRACSKIRMYLKNFPLRFLFSALLFQVLVRPFFEVFWFRQHPACFLLNVSALRVNLFRLRETFIARSRVQALGKCRARSRFRDLVTVALDRFSNKQYYRF
jgi:GT2 family glycosyltransferase